MTSERPTTTTTVPDLCLETLTLGGGEVLVAPLHNGPSSPAQTAETDYNVAVTVRTMGFVLAAPDVLGEHGLLWFDIGPTGVKIAAAGELIEFRHETGAAAPSPASSFGVSAPEFSSIVRWSRKYLGNNPLQLIVESRARTVFVKPDHAILTGGVPVEHLLVDITGATMFDDIDPQTRAEAYDRKLPQWRLKGYFDQPAELDCPIEEGQVPFDNKTLQHVLTDAGKLIPGDKTKLGMIQLKDGCLYGGTEEMLFGYDVPMLAAHELVIARPQLDPFLTLLRLLRSSLPCRIGQDGPHHTFSNDETTIVLRAVGKPHPASPSNLQVKGPRPAVRVRASDLAKQLSATAKGEVENAKFVFLHLTLTSGVQPTLKIESRDPRDGQQLVRGADLAYETNDSNVDIDCLANLNMVKKALTQSTGTVLIQATEKALYIVSEVPGAARVTRTVRVPAVRAEPPSQLARQVRKLARAQGLGLQQSSSKALGSPAGGSAQSKSSD